MPGPEVECRCPKCGSRCHFKNDDGWDDFGGLWIHRHDDGINHAGEYMTTRMVKKRFVEEKL